MTWPLRLPQRPVTPPGSRAATGRPGSAVTPVRALRAPLGPSQRGDPGMGPGFALEDHSHPAQVVAAAGSPNGEVGFFLYANPSGSFPIATGGGGWFPVYNGSDFTVAVDAVVPDSGIILLELEGMPDITGNASGFAAYYYWSVDDGGGPVNVGVVPWNHSTSNPLAVGVPVMNFGNGLTLSADVQRVTRRFVPVVADSSGNALAPGATMTLRWIHRLQLQGGHVGDGVQMDSGNLFCMRQVGYGSVNPQLGP